MDDLVGGLIETGIGLIADPIMQKWQNDQNRALYYEQREYNKPLNQVARLKEAGLNPALMYGTGTGANVAGTPPTMGRTEKPDLPTDLMKYNQMKLSSAQIEQTAAQIHLIQEQARRAAAETVSAQEKSRMDKYLADYYLDPTKNKFNELPDDPGEVRLWKRGVGSAVSLLDRYGPRIKAGIDDLNPMPKFKEYMKKNTEEYNKKELPRKAKTPQEIQRSLAW